MLMLFNIFTVTGLELYILKMYYERAEVIVFLQVKM